MAELYTVHINNIYKSKFRVTTFGIHPDAGPVPKNKVWGLQILMELFWRLKTNSLGKTAQKFALTEEEQQKQLRCHPFYDLYDYWEILWQGETIALIKSDLTEQELIEIKEQLSYKGQKFSSYGSTDEGFELKLMPEFQKFINEAELMILNLALLSTETKKLNDEWNSVTEQVVIEFEVVDRHMLYHLRRGMVYKTAAYDITYEV